MARRKGGGDAVGCVRGEVKKWVHSEPLGRGNVWIVTPWYGRQSAGGVAIASANLVQALRQLGIDSLVVVPTGDGWWPQSAKGDGGETIIHLPVRGSGDRGAGVKAFLGYWCRVPIVWLSTVFLLCRWGCRVVHFQYCVPAYDELRRIFRLLNIPMLTTFQGSEIALYGGTCPLRDVIKRLIRDSERLTTVSGDLLEKVLRIEPNAISKSRVVLNTAPLWVWRESHRSCWNGAREIDVLFVGHLISVKGPDILVKAFRIVSEKRPGTRMTIVGEGDMERSLRGDLMESGLLGEVEFTGRVSSESIVEYYRRAKIVVIPSRSEGLPLVAVEAAVMGLPVVATTVGGLPEVVVDGESGILVPPNDEKRLAEALLLLLNDPGWATRLGEKGRDRALALSNPILMAEAYISLYQEMAA